MRIDHLVIWTTDLDRCLDFYATNFGATAGPRYHNPANGKAVWHSIDDIPYAS